MPKFDEECGSGSGENTGIPTHITFINAQSMQATRERVVGSRSIVMYLDSSVD